MNLGAIENSNRCLSLREMVTLLKPWSSYGFISPILLWYHSIYIIDCIQVERIVLFDGQIYGYGWSRQANLYAAPMPTSMIQPIP